MMMMMMMMMAEAAAMMLVVVVVVAHRPTTCPRRPTTEVATAHEKFATAWPAQQPYGRRRRRWSRRLTTDLTDRRPRSRCSRKFAPTAAAAAVMMMMMMSHRLTPDAAD
jgi:hypothetical protein